MLIGKRKLKRMLGRLDSKITSFNSSLIKEYNFELACIEDTKRILDFLDYSARFSEFVKRCLDGTIPKCEYSEKMKEFNAEFLALEEKEKEVEATINTLRQSRY